MWSHLFRGSQLKNAHVHLARRSAGVGAINIMNISIFPKLSATYLVSVLCVINLSSSQTVMTKVCQECNCRCFAWKMVTTISQPVGGGGSGGNESKTAKLPRAIPKYFRRSSKSHEHVSEAHQSQTDLLLHTVPSSQITPRSRWSCGDRKFALHIERHKEQQTKHEPKKEKKKTRIWPRSARSYLAEIANRTKK